MIFGEMAEWTNALVLKTRGLKGSGGSNPSLTAIFEMFGALVQPG